MKSILVVFLAALPALAGPLEVGFKAGVPLTDFLSTARSPNFGFNSQTKRYILGASRRERVSILDDNRISYL